MTPTRTLARVLSALAALALLPLLALAQEEGEGLAIETPDFNKSKILQEAALVQPLPPRTLQRLLPESFAGLARTKAEGKVNWIGPAGQTRVEALYGGAQGGVKILVLDPAGLPPGGREYMEKVPVGETQTMARSERRGVRIGDFEATVEVFEGVDFARVQAFAGPRLRVSAESMSGLTLDQLVAAMEELDLGAFAALAPDAPPDLSERIETPE